MSKKNIVYLVVSVAGILVCSVWFFLNKKSSLPKFIPSDAIGVIRINPLSIVSKLEMKEIKDMKSYDDMMDELDNAGIQISEMFENTNKSGISLSDNIYFFSDNEDKDQNVGMLLAVSNPTQLRDFLERFAKKNRLKYKEKEDLFMYVAENDDDYNKISIVWNADVCLFYSAKENSMSAAKKILHQPEEKSILSSGSFRKSEDKGGDVSLFINNKNLQDLIEEEMQNGNMEEIFPKKLKDYMQNVDGSSIVLNFNDDNITLEGIQYFKDNNKTEQFSLIAEQGISEEGLNFISSNGDILMGISTVLNMEEILKLLKSIPNYDDVQEEIQSSLGLSERELENLLNGTFTFSINEIKIKEVERLVYDYNNYNYELGDFEHSYEMVSQPIPMFSIQIGLKDQKVFNKLMEKLKEIENENVKQNGNLITVTTNSEIGDVSIVQSNNYVVLTNDAVAAREMKSNGKWNPPSNAEVNTLFRDNPVAAYLDLDLESYGGNKKLKTILGINDDETQEFRLTKKLMNNFKSLTFYSNSKSSSVNVNMKPGNGNSLMKLIRIVDEVASEEKRKY